MIRHSASRSVMGVWLGTLGAALAWLLIYGISKYGYWKLPWAVGDAVFALVAFSLSLSGLVAQTRGARNGGMITIALISLWASLFAGCYCAAFAYFCVRCGSPSSCL